MKVSVLNIKGKDTGREVELSKKVFQIEASEHAVYLDVKQYLANQRQGNAKTKERAEIKGSTRKIKKQKGTGTARAGSIKNPLFKGVRHILQAEPNGFLLGENFQNGINKLKDFNLTYDILIYPKHLKEAIDLVKKNPDQAFVLDHIAKPLIKNKEIDDWSMGILEIGSFKNVYCKLSGLVTEADWKNWSKSDFKDYLKLVLNAFGVDRLMFGSDWPVCLLAGNYGQVLNIIEDFIEVLSDDEKRKIMGGNACKFYKIY